MSYNLYYVIFINIKIVGVFSRFKYPSFAVKEKRLFLQTILKLQVLFFKTHSGCSAVR